MEVNFHHTSDGTADGTCLALEHRGWERRPDGAAMRGAYLQGQPVLAGFAARAA